MGPLTDYHLLIVVMILCYNRNMPENEGFGKKGFQSILKQGRTNVFSSLA
jgi:hypothetical protein